MLSSLLFSCENVKEQSEIYENKISSPTDLPLTAKSAEFLALTESGSENSVLMEQCDCEYKILSVVLPPLNGGAARNNTEFRSIDECQPFCDIFKISFSSDGLCKSNFGICNQNWAYLMVDYQPFSCSIDAFSGFYSYLFSSFQTGVDRVGCAGFQHPGSPRLTISIKCQKEDDPECGGTDTNTIIIDTSAYEEYGKFLTGGDCGCVPHFLKFQNPDDPS